MAVRPWMVGASLLVIFGVVIGVQDVPGKPWIFLGFLPVLGLTIFFFYKDNKHGSGWEDEFKTEQQIHQEKNGVLVGENSILAPLRGQPAMWAVALVGLIAAILLLGQGNRTQIPIFWLAGLVCFVAAGYSLALASMPKVEKAGNPSKDQPETTRPSSNPHGVSSYGSKKASKNPKLVLAVVAFLALSAGLGAFLLSETVGFGNLFEAEDLRGHSVTGFNHMQSLGSDADQFTMTGTLEQSGSSKIFAIPNGTTQWNVTISWTRFTTDNGGQELLIEELVAGEWIAIENFATSSPFSEEYKPRGDSWRMSLSAGASTGDRTVQVNVDYAQDVETECFAKDGDEPTCTTRPKDA